MKTISAETQNLIIELLDYVRDNCFDVANSHCDGDSEPFGQSTYLVKLCNKIRNDLEPHRLRRPQADPQDLRQAVLRLLRQKPWHY